MRLRDVLPHANFVASAVEMTDLDLFLSSRRAAALHRRIQGQPGMLYDMLFAFDIEMDLPDWRDHILALMLLRDCLGREMVRRGLTPPGPPMLARNWESGGMYPLSESVGVVIPQWLLERGRRELAAGPVDAYTGTEGEKHG